MPASSATETAPPRPAPAGAPAAARSQSFLALLASGAPLSILFGGGSFVATRVALGAYDPVAIVALRFLLGAALVYGVLAVRRLPLLPERADRARCALLGLILGGHLLIQAFAMLFTSATNSGWIVGFSPVAIALGAQLFLRERLRSVGWAGVAIASGGVFVVTLAKSPDFARAGVGDLLVFSSTITWAAYTLLSSRPVARSGALRVTAFAMAVAALVATGFALARPEAGGLLEAGALRGRSFLAVLYLGLLCSGVSFTIWLRAVERFGAAQTGVLIYFQPFVTAVVATLYYADEPLTVHALAGGPLVLLGVALVRRGRARS